MVKLGFCEQRLFLSEGDDETPVEPSGRAVVDDVCVCVFDPSAAVTTVVVTVVFVPSAFVDVVFCTVVVDPSALLVVVGADVVVVVGVVVGGRS